MTPPIATVALLDDENNVIGSAESAEWEVVELADGAWGARLHAYMDIGDEAATQARCTRRDGEVQSWLPLNVPTGGPGHIHVVVEMRFALGRSMYQRAGVDFEP